MKRLQISITTVCNMACPTCYHGIPKIRNPKHASIEELEKIHTFFPNIEILVIMGGEPTLHPEFKELLDDK